MLKEVERIINSQNYIFEDKNKGKSNQIILKICDDYIIKKNGKEKIKENTMCQKVETFIFPRNGKNITKIKQKAITKIIKVMTNLRETYQCKTNMKYSDKKLCTLKVYDVQENLLLNDIPILEKKGFKKMFIYSQL